MRISTYCKLLAATDDITISWNWTRTLIKCGLLKELGIIIPQLYAKGSLCREDLLTLAEYLPSIGGCISISSGSAAIDLVTFLEWYRLDIEELYAK